MIAHVRTNYWVLHLSSGHEPPKGIRISCLQGRLQMNMYRYLALVILCRFNHTPVIMASGRELCYVLLSGICMCYGMAFVILARPTVIRCAILRVGLGEATIAPTYKIVNCFRFAANTVLPPAMAGYHGKFHFPPHETLIKNQNRWLHISEYSYC